MTGCRHDYPLVYGLCQTFMQLSYLSSNAFLCVLHAMKMSLNLIANLFWISCSLKCNCHCSFQELTSLM